MWINTHSPSLLTWWPVWQEEIFSQNYVDLTAVYQQILLDDNSSKLVVINIHQGLCRYTRLLFGVALATIVFQQTMDSILQGMSYVICYIDYILITGTNVAEHDNNLEEILKRLKEYGVHLKQEKYSLFTDSIKYLGHHISANGVHTTRKKHRPYLKLLNQGIFKN